MSKIDDVLKNWEENAYLCPTAIQNLLKDIREAMKGCTVLEWHPASEKPPRTGLYLVAKDIPRYGLRYDCAYWTGQEFRCTNGDLIIEWAKLPERTET